MPYAHEEDRIRNRREYYEKHKEEMIKGSLESLRRRMKDPEYAADYLDKKRKRHHERKNDPVYIAMRKIHATKSQLKAKYGMTEEMYWLIHKKQNGKCAICGMAPKEGVSKSSRTLVIDHCHDTNKVRGLICHQCNIMLGMARNKQSIFIKAIEYLERA